MVWVALCLQGGLAQPVLAVQGWFHRMEGFNLQPDDLSLSFSRSCHGCHCCLFMFVQDCVPLFCVPRWCPTPPSSAQQPSRGISQWQSSGSRLGEWPGHIGAALKARAIHSSDLAQAAVAQGIAPNVVTTRSCSFGFCASCCCLTHVENSANVQYRRGNRYGA